MSLRALWLVFYCLIVGDVNECSDDTLNECHDDANCTDTLGSYTCMCKERFTGDGRTCVALDPSSPTQSSSSDNTLVIIGAVVAALVVIVTVIVFGCVLYRRLGREDLDKDRNCDYVQNTAYQGDAQPNGELSDFPYSEDTGYEQPSAYQQLDTFKRAPTNENYQSLKRSDPESGDASRNASNYVIVMDTPKNGDSAPKESIYEELPEHAP